ncbi:hypothetical protein C4D60_Mb02t20660 [Musa balbisiana]|uniref:Uncharacterized protein n=1 Tax=Musa balbisiana TaxID=52838 RepID=A0A4S8IEI6_MUSBA|nr:hypothetical protein C4D60_Mb02t20660 [Musa balbisiana]
MGEIDRGCKKRSAEERAEGFGDVSSDEGEHLVTTTSFASVPVKLVRVGLVKPGTPQYSLKSENPQYYHNHPQTPFPPSLLRYLLLRSSSVDRDTESRRGGLLLETRGSLCCYRLACSNRDVFSQAQPTAASAQSRYSFVLLEGGRRE